MKLIRFKKGEERIKGFSNPVKKAERTNDWAWWGLFGAAIIIEVVAILKILEKM